MRTIAPEFQARLDSGATTMCRCWKVERRDGVILGFTDHDGGLTIDGIQYLADSGMDAGALQSSNGLSVDNGQVVGALKTEAISEADIRAGRFDEAEVWHWLVDWRQPDQRVLLFRGRLGEIQRKDGLFEVELRGLTERLNVPVGRSILRTCDRILGDAKCGFDFDTAGFSAEGTVGDPIGAAKIACNGLNGFAEGWFEHGLLEWLDGENAGQRAVVKTDERKGGTSRTLELWQAPRLTVAAGDRFRVVAGCDKRADTCRNKFGNFLNFRGFPHIPGEDWVVAYPKEGEVHDGGSLGRS